MKRVGPIVNSERIFFAVERKFPAGDAVSVAADQAAKEGVIREIAIEAIVAEDDVTHDSVAIGRFEGHDNPSIVADAGLDTLAVAQSKQIHFSPILGMAKRLAANLRVGRRCRSAAQKKQAAV